MIVEHVVKGSKETTLHSFHVSINKLNLIISNGSYFRANIEYFKLSDDTTINFISQTENTYYEIWLTDNGISILTRKEDEDFAYEQLVNPIDRIVYFNLPTNCTDLNKIDIHFVKVVE
jgi:hypothetical protein